MSGQRQIAMIAEWLDNKSRADELTNRNREIAQELAGMVKGKGKIEGNGLKATISTPIYTKWDQAGLENARQIIGNEVFFRVFKPEFKPKAKALLDAWLDSADPALATPVIKAMTTKPGLPQLKVVAA